MHALISVFSCRHSDSMIKRLEGAGLGFFVQATETQQKLGTSLAIYLVMNVKLVFRRIEGYLFYDEHTRAAI